jgi:hypothetical protein
MLLSRENLVLREIALREFPAILFRPEVSEMIPSHGVIDFLKGFHYGKIWTMSPSLGSL